MGSVRGIQWRGKREKSWMVLYKEKKKQPNHAETYGKKGKRPCVRKAAKWLQDCSSSKKKK